MREIVVEVTADDIARGVREDECRCPVARAVRRATRRRLIYAGGSRITAHRADGLAEPFFDLRTPNEVTDFVFAFDNQHEVKPFRFTLSIPEKEARPNGEDTGEERP